MQISLACGDYDRTEALRDGTVGIPGMEIRYVVAKPPELFERMLKKREFDAAEMSFSTYLRVWEKGDPGLVAIPVFPSRNFRHGNIYVQSSSDLREPQDMVGKRIGIADYGVTAAVWIRGFLWHDFGVRPMDVRWVTGKKSAPVAGVEMEEAPPGARWEELLLQGKIDALIQTGMPAELGKRVRRLFADPKRVEMDYFRRTGIFPIMHTLVLRQEVYQEYPWLAKGLYDAFEQAKKKCQDEMYQSSTLKYSLAWLVDDIEEEKELLGDDPWPYGLKANSRVLETLVTYVWEQGLIAQKPKIEELFVPECR